jgi:predicted alpha/beta superfamily hydrolase
VDGCCHSIHPNYPKICEIKLHWCRHLWWNNEQLLKALERRPERAARLKQTRFWIDMGELEGSTTAIQRANVERAHQFADVLKKHHTKAESDIHWLEVKDGKHNETSWAQRFGDVLEFLFKPIEDD